MKQSNYSFAEGFYATPASSAKAAGATQKAFDWDKAAQLIKGAFEKHADLTAEAGLQGDWAYTGGEIFRDGKPTNHSYTYLSSNWATPTLILSWDGSEQEEIGCFCEANERFSEKSKWDEKSLEILGIPL